MRTSFLYTRILFVILGISVTSVVWAISYPTSAPQNEQSGGWFTTYFRNMYTSNPLCSTQSGAIMGFVSSGAASNWYEKNKNPATGTPICGWPVASGFTGSKLEIGTHPKSYLQHRNGNLEIHGGGGTVTIGWALNVSNLNVSSKATIQDLDVQGNMAINHLRANTAHINKDLEVWDDLHVKGLATIAKTLAVKGKVTSEDSISAKSFFYTSDAWKKTQITPLNSSLQKLLRLRGYSFAWKDTGVRDIGLIAQEVEMVFPELIGTGVWADGSTYKTVKYGNLIAPVIWAITELSVRMDMQEKRIAVQEERIAAQEKQIQYLLQRIEAQDRLLWSAQ